MIIYDKCQDSNIILWKDCANDIIKFAQQDDIENIINIYTNHPFCDFRIRDKKKNNLSEIASQSKSIKVQKFLKSIQC